MLVQTGRNEEKNIDGGGDYAMLKQGQREKQQENLTGEVALGVKEWIFSVVFREVCTLYLIPFQSPKVRQIHELFN